MNLWAKSFGRLAVLAVALFFFSCDEETSQIGFKNPNPKFNVAYVDIPLESSLLSVDSVVTDHYGTFGSHLVGAVNDPTTGRFHTETYLDLLPVSTAKLDATSVYDSLTFQARLDFHSYGFTGAQTMKFTIHQLTGERLLLEIDSTNRFKKRYYANSTVAYNPEPLGRASVFVDYDSLIKQASLPAASQDTLLIRGRLSDDFGRYLFQLALDDPGSQFSDPNLFGDLVKGLVLTPDNEATGILRISATHALSKVILHYHTATDTTERAFSYGRRTVIPNFTKITADRSATEFAAAAQTHQNFIPMSDLRVVQSGVPLLTKLDLSKFYEFADTISNLVVNSAELVINDVQSPAGSPVHGAMTIKVMHNNDDYFANARMAADATALRSYRLVGYPDHYFILAESVSDAVPEKVFYNSTDRRYSAFLTLFTQSLFNGRKTETGINTERIRYLALFPDNPGVSTSISRTIFNKNNVRLRIYYTTPVSTPPNN